MSPILWTAVFLVSGASIAPGQTTWYVDDDNCPSHGTGTPSDPFCAIQDGIAAALDGDTVLVLPGNYPEAIDLLGKAIVVKSRDGAATTSITGDGVAPVVTVDSGEGRDSVVEGFTITGGGYWNSAGGIVCSSSPTIRANVIEGNGSNFGTGGILSSGDALIVGNRIVGNGSGYGAGGMSLSGNSVAEDNWIEGNGSGLHAGGVTCFGHAVLRRNTIVANSTSDGLVGGLYCGENAQVEGNRILGNTFTTDALVGGVLCRDDCVLNGNEVAGNQGGIYCADSPTLVNNLVSGNTFLGGIYCVGVSVTMVNNTIHGNSSSVGAGGVTCVSGSVTIANSILWKDQGASVTEIAASGPGVTVAISWSDVQGGTGSILSSSGGSVVWGAGMIDADPKFVDADGLDDDAATPDDNDFHIAALSPCVDAGDNTAPGLPALDFEDDPRPFDVPGAPDTGNGTPPLADMGCDEFQSHLYFKGDATPGGLLALHVTGLPGGSPVFVWIALDLLDPPLTTRLGPWFLAPPLHPVYLQPIPADGVLTVLGNIPSSPPAPYTIHAQAVILSGPVLTNLASVDVH